MSILGVYKITYLNYKEPIIQYKNLILHSSYLEVIKPKYEKIYDFEVGNKKKEAKILKKELLNEFGEQWFTDKSPIFEAITTDKLDCLYIVHNVKVEKV